MQATNSHHALVLTQENFIGIQLKTIRTINYDANPGMMWLPIRLQ